MHEFEDDELVFHFVNDGDEVQTGEPLVHDLVFLVVEEVAHLRVACDDHLIDLLQVYLTSFKMRCLYD